MLGPRAVIKGRNPQHLLQLSMIDFPLMLQVEFPVVDRIQPQSNKFATGVENNTTGDPKFNDSPASVDIVYGTDPWFYFQLIYSHTFQLVDKH